MSTKEFAQQYFLNLGKVTPNEQRLREAIKNGTVTPQMTLREIGTKAGLGDNPQLIRHYLLKFLKQPEERDQ